MTAAKHKSHRAPHPKAHAVRDRRDTSAVPRAVYCGGAGSDRLGSIEQRGTEFIARDRQGRRLSFSLLKVPPTPLWSAHHRGTRRKTGAVGMSAARKIAQENSLADVDWGAKWDTAAAAEMLARVREACGVHVGEPELTDEMVAAALREAREILDRHGEPEEPLLAETEAETADVDGEADELTSFKEACSRADARARAKPVAENILLRAGCSPTMVRSSARWPR
jgi:hypothetical protein